MYRESTPDTEGHFITRGRGQVLADTTPCQPRAKMKVDIPEIGKDTCKPWTLVRVSAEYLRVT